MKYLIYGGHASRYALWQCLSHHFDELLEAYKERFQPRYGFLPPIIPEVVEKFLECGDLARSFAHIRCDHCKEDRLLAFPCKGRWFCTSCHQKKVQLFGALLAESILYPVPHRHFVFGIPKMLRPYFPLRPRFAQRPLPPRPRVPDRVSAHKPGPARRRPRHCHGHSHLRRVSGLHPHLHALVADGLFARSGVFHVIPRAVRCGV